MPVAPSEEPTVVPADEGDEATLAAEPGSTRGDDSVTLPAGSTRLGHHVLLHVLGRGGMGVVYAAYDEKLDRKVAIKLLHGRGGPTVQRRLAREAQALARLSHSNVVQIYEIGEYRVGTNDVAFLVMEFIDGVTLRDWLAERARSQAEVIATFLAAGRGLAAAHAQGLIHRDFKPDNVMICRDGRVVVMDFGLARGDDSIEIDSGPLEPGRERTSELSMQLTQAGAMTGTPGYMAPEQFAGAATDARTDQFSFCVALWEALYRQRPFRGDNLAALSLAVTQGERVEPTDGGVPSWLRAVLDRGLAGDPAARWPTMNDLLAALERDPTRRRRALFAGAGVVALTVVGVLAVAIARDRQRDAAIAQCERDGQAIVEDWNDQVAAKLERSFVATRANFAGSAWAHTQPWMDDYARTWSALHTETCKQTRVERTRSEESSTAIMQCLDQRRATFVGLIDAWDHADLKMVTRAPMAASGLSPVSGCTTESNHGELPPADIREQVAALRVSSEQVRAMQLVGEYEPALARALEILAEAEAVEWLPAQADAKLLVANLQLKLGKYVEARASAEAAFLDAVRSADESAMLVACQTLTYVVGFKLGDHDQGEYWGEVGKRLLARLELAGTAREAGLLIDIGLVQADRGRYTESIESQRKALAIQESVLGPEHPAVAACHVGLGLALAGQGDYRLAREHFEIGVALQLAALGPDHPDVATAIHNIAVSHMGQGQNTDALAGFERALALREAALGPQHPNVAATLGNMGYVRHALGQNEAAIRDLRRALAILDTAYGPDAPPSIGLLNNLGLVYVTLGDDEQALSQFRRALAISVAKGAETGPEAAGSLLNIADLLLERGAWLAAREQYSRALAALSTAPDHPWIGLATSGLGRIDLELGERVSARELLDQARAIEERTNAEPIELAKTRFGLARLAWANADLVGAREHAEAARESCVKAGTPGDRLLARIDAWLAGLAPDQSPPDQSP